MSLAHAALSNAIVVGVDESSESMDAARWAARDAVVRGCSLVLVHADPGLDASFSDAFNLRGGPVAVVRSRARSTLTRAENAVEAIVGARVSVDGAVEPGRPADVLIEYAKSSRMVVVGSRGTHAFARGLLGSVGDRVATHAHCPAALVPRGRSDTSDSNLLPVLVGVDIATDNEPILSFAFDEASARGVGLRALHARTGTEYRLDPQPPAEDWLDRTVSRWAARYPSVPVSTSVVEDSPSHALVDDARTAQLVVVGARGRAGITAALLGSTSRAVLHQAPVPTVVVHAHGHTTHATGGHL